MFYGLVGIIVRAILAIGTRSTVIGGDRIPGAGPFILVANHLNLVDPPVLGSLLPRRITFMAKEELFGIPVVGWVVKWYGAFSVRRGQPDRQALRTATEVLQHGGALGIFPEGHRSESGEMIDAHPGAALIAVMSGAPVVPVAIVGTERLRSPLSLFVRPRIVIRVGEPFVLEREGSRKEGLESATRHMMGRVASLLPVDRRGVYAADARNDDSPLSV